MSMRKRLTYQEQDFANNRTMSKTIPRKDSMFGMRFVLSMYRNLAEPYMIVMWFKFGSRFFKYV